MKVISSYFGNRILRHVRDDMLVLARDGFTGVVHTFDENDNKYYKKSFKEIVKISHDAGLDVDLDPWGVGGVFGGESFSAWVAENPQFMQVSRDGKSRPCACLNSREFREYMKTWIDAAVESGTDGLFWDEPHLYIARKNEGSSVWTCACPICQKMFSEKFQMEMPWVLTPEIQKFRSDTIIDFLREMLIHGKSSGMRNTVCLLPVEFAGDNALAWEETAQLDGIDILSTDPYWILAKKDAAEFVGHYSHLVKCLADKRGIESQIWILGFRIPSGREGEIETAIDTAYREGIRNMAIWSFEATAQMSYLRCDDPEKAWRTAVNAFGKYRTGK